MAEEIKDIATTCGDCPSLSADIIKNETEKKTTILFYCLAKAKEIEKSTYFLKSFEINGLSIDNKLPKYEDYPPSCEKRKEYHDFSDNHKYMKSAQEADKNTNDEEND